MLFTDYSMAKAQSYGFFYDIRLEEWELMRQRMRYERMNLQKRLTSDLQPNLIYGQPSNSWYQHNYEQDFSCKHERKIGGIGEGAKWVCDPHRIPRSQSTYEHIVLNGPRNRNTEETPSRCLVYSIGNKGNFQFEFGLQDLIGKKVCEIHIFDSPEYIESYKKLAGLQDDNVFFHPWMLKGSQELSIQGDYKTFQDTVQILGHRDRVIDILKIDCEGCEWDTYKDWLYTKVTIMQILVQLHGSPRHPHDFFHKLHYHNYVTFHKEPSTLFKGGEYSFLKLAPEFFT